MPLKQNSHTVFAILICMAFPARAEGQRQLGAHVHGHGRLNIAMEDKTLSVELEAPGADIVGFEHEPDTPAQAAALEEAKTKLAGGLSLFAPAAAAGCTQKSAKVSAEAGLGDGDGHEREGGRHAGDEAMHHHSEFHAEYVFECASPSRLATMTFGYFKAFPNAQELDISLISPKGQASYEVKRDRPSLDLTGIL